MKIAQVVSTYPPYKGGTGNVAYNFAVELQRRGISVETFVPRYSKETTSQEGIHFIRPFFTIGNGACIPQVYAKVKDADVILLHVPFFGGMESILFRKLFHRKQKLVVFYHQDLIPPSDFLRNVLFRLYNTLLLPLIALLADKILFSSLDYGKHSNLRRYIEKYPQKFGEARLAVDHAIFRPLDPEELRLFREGISKRRKAKIIGFVGNIASTHYFKGIEVLLDALKLVENKGDDFVLCLAGKGNRVVYFKERVQKMGLSDRVKFLEGLDDAELNKLYNASDIVVLPSINKAEAFGLVLVEAMATGTPVIASNLPGVRTVFEDAVSGFVFPIKASAALAEKIHILLTDEELRKRMGEAALVRSQQFTWSATADVLEQLFKSYENRNYS